MLSRFVHHDHHDHILSSHRLEALTDGVFAIAMTILVLGLDLPEFGNQETLAQSIYEEGLRKSIIKMWPQIAHYLISFLILGSLWIAHSRQMKIIVRTDFTHLWLNVVFLMMICVVPFSTSLLGDHPTAVSSQMFFHLNMLCVGLALMIHWGYAVTGRRLVADEVSPALLRFGSRVNLALPICACLAAALAPLIGNWSSAIYLGIGPCVAAMRLTFAKKNH